MGGKKVSFVLAAVHLLSVPGFDQWSCMPRVWHVDEHTRYSQALRDSERTPSRGSMILSPSNKDVRVALVVGGMSYERDDVSQAADAVWEVLSRWGYDVSRCSLVNTVAAEILLRTLPRVCFVIDPFYIDQAGSITRVCDLRPLLEKHKIAYTGVNSATAEICRDKISSKHHFASLGIDIPKDLRVPAVVSPGWITDAAQYLGLPFIVKPTCEGAGAGVSLCHRIADADHMIHDVRTRYGDTMLEEYIDGIEITVPVIGRGPSAQALPPVELELLDSPIYDHATKRNPDRVLRFVPARLLDVVLHELQAQALRIHTTLGGGGVTRTDFRVSQDARIVCLEINACPALGPDEHVARSARETEITYDALILRILRDALENCQ